MTFTFETYEDKDVLIEISQEKFENTYRVKGYKNHGGQYGFPFTETIYPTKEKAKRRFNYLRNKAKKGELL